MPRPIKILFADDSAAVRRLISEKLKACDGLEIAGAARNGLEAVELHKTLRPDVVLLDVEMPVMDGIDALRKIRQGDKTTPVLMFSSLTVKGAEATLDALSLGACDYVGKPTGTTNIQQAMAHMDRELVPLIRRWGERSLKRDISHAVPGKPKIAPAPIGKRHSGQVDIVAIGSSTGGPNALAEMIPKLPANIGVPVVIVQHMPTVFTKLLAERLDKLSPLKISEAQDGASLSAGEVLIAPGDYHMVVERTPRGEFVRLNQGPPENSCRPAVDVLFRSVSKAYGGDSLAVVLTGMGKDGLEGCRHMKQHGTFVVAQDQASSTIWGMPRAVAEAGLSDTVIPLSEMHSEILRRVRLRKPSRVAATV